MLNDALYLAMSANGQSGDVTVESLTITEDGVYTAPTGKAYSPVIVTVEESIYSEILSQTWGS